MSDLTPARLADLRAVAKAATPGHWRRTHHGTWEVEAPPNQLVADCGTVDLAEQDAAHIAAFDPPTVLALLEEIERLRRLAEKVRIVVPYVRATLPTRVSGGQIRETEHGTWVECHLGRSTSSRRQLDSLLNLVADHAAKEPADV